MKSLRSIVPLIPTVFATILPFNAAMASSPSLQLDQNIEAASVETIRVTLTATADRIIEIQNTGDVIIENPRLTSLELRDSFNQPKTFVFYGGYDESKLDREIKKDTVAKACKIFQYAAPNSEDVNSVKTGWVADRVIYREAGQWKLGSGDRRTSGLAELRCSTPQKR